MSIQRPLPSNHHHAHQQIHHQLSHHSPPYHHEMINKQAHFFPILAQSQVASQLANIKRESSPLCHMDMDSPKSLLGTPMAMDTSGRHYFSEDTLLSSDSSTISETILASEDSCFSNHSNLTSPHSSNTVDMSDFIGRLNESTQMVNNNSTSSPDVLQQQHHQQQQQQQQQQRTFENIHVQQSIGNGFATPNGNEAVTSNTNGVHMVNLHSSLVSVNPTPDTGHYLQTTADSECMMKQLNHLAAGGVGSPPKAENQFFTMSMVNGSNGMTAVSVIAAHQQQQQTVQATTNTNCQSSTIPTTSSLTNAQASPSPGSVSSHPSSTQLIVDNASLSPSQLMPPPPIPCNSMMVVKDEPSSSMGVSPSPPSSMDATPTIATSTPHSMLPDNDIHNVTTTGGLGITSSTVATVNNGTLSHDNLNNNHNNNHNNNNINSSTSTNISNMSISNSSSRIVNQTSTPSESIVMDTASLPSSLTMNSCTVPVTASPPTRPTVGTINPMQIVANNTNGGGGPVVVTTNTSAVTPNGGGPTVIQASQISAMSQMSDTELIRLINPSTFDEFREDVSMFNNFPFPSSNIYRK